MTVSVTRRGLLLGAIGAGVLGTGVVLVQDAGEPDAAAPGPAAALRIGAVVPLEGVLAPDGRQARDGAALAVAQLNARGGVRGRPLELVVVSADVTDGASVAAAMHDLVAREVAAFVHGYVIDFEQAYAVASAYGAPYLHASSSQEQRTQVALGGPALAMIFQTTPSDRVAGSSLPALFEQLADEAGTPSRGSISLVQRTIPHTSSIAEGLTAAVDASAGRWTRGPDQLLVQPVRDWSPQLAALRAAGPSVVVVNTPDPVEAGAFVAAYLKTPLPALLYLAGEATPAFRSAAGSTQGLLWSRLAGRYPDAVGERFMRDFTGRHGRAPDASLASATYDAVHLLAKAWAQPGTFDKAAAVQALRAIEHRGVNGGYAFDDSPGRTVASYPSESTDRARSQAHQVFQDQDGGSQLVAPTFLARAVVRRPPWLPG